MEMTDDFRLRIAVPYLLLMVISLMAIMLPMWARTLGVLGAFTGAFGFVWACWGSVGDSHRARIARWRVRSTSSNRSTQDGPTGTAEREWIHLGVPCAPEIYDEMTQAVAEGWRLAQVPGRPEDPRIVVDGPHGYRTTLEKPRER